jgi:hypothetical protein
MKSHKKYAPEGISFEQIINENPEMEASVNSFDWVKCPNCGISFKVTNPESWNGVIHIACEQKIQLIDKESQGSKESNFNLS